VDFTKSRFEKFGNIFRSKILGYTVVFVKGRVALSLFSSGPERGLGAAPEAYIFDSCTLYPNQSRRRATLVSENDHQHSFKRLFIMTSIKSLFAQSGFLDIRLRDTMMKWCLSVCDTPDSVSGVTLCSGLFLNISISILLREFVEKHQLKFNIEAWLKTKQSYPVNALGLSNWDRGNTALRELDNLITKEIQNRVLTGKHGDDLLGCMLNAAESRSAADSSNSSSLDEVVEKTVLTDCWSFLESMTSSTAAACVWLLVCLEQAPGMKQALITEVRNFEGEVDIHFLQNPSVLPYMESTIEESLRLFGFLDKPFLKRVALFDINFEGKLIPKDTIVYLPLSSLNFDDTFFPLASTFDPLRFTPGGANELKDPPSFTFGVGHHSCPGAMFVRAIMKLFLFTLLDGFDTSALRTQSFAPRFPRDPLLSFKLGRRSPPAHYPVPEDGMMFSTFTARPLRENVVLRSKGGAK
jgi:cytochrome P450